MSSLLSIGATVLKVSADKIFEYYASEPTDDEDVSKVDVNKIGEAAPVDIKSTEEQLTPEDLLQKQQAIIFIHLISSFKFIKFSGFRLCIQIKSSPDKTPAIYCPRTCQ